MALVVDATVGGASSNSYVTRANADTYFEGRAFSSSWTGKTGAEKDVALVMATSIFERIKWVGSKGMTTAGALTQALAWPRQWAPTLEVDAAPEIVAEYFIDTSVSYYASTAIPAPIAHGCCELALEILKAGTVDPFLQDATHVKVETVDVITTEFFDSQDAVRGLARFPHVLALVQPLFRTATYGIEVQRV